MKAPETSKNYVMVTGASSGLGYEIAKLYAIQGRSLVLIGRNRDLLKKIKLDFESKYKIKIHIFCKDLVKNNNVNYLYNQCKKRNLIIDVLINNAGIGFYGNFHNLSWEKISGIINLNMIALTKLTYLFSNEMIKRKSGKILNVASIAGFFPGPYMSIYHASKSFVISLTRALADEFRNSGISVSVLCPGYTSSNFQKRAGLKGKRLADLTVMSSHKVAKIAVQEFDKNKGIIITGTLNKLAVSLSRLMPSNLSTKLIGLFWKQL